MRRAIGPRVLAFGMSLVFVGSIGPGDERAWMGIPTSLGTAWAAPLPKSDAAGSLPSLAAQMFARSKGVFADAKEWNGVSSFFDLSQTSRSRQEKGLDPGPVASGATSPPLLSKARRFFEKDPPLHLCDRLAASPADGGRKAQGTPIKRLDADRAIPACEQAVALYPNAPRFQYQFGRALHKAGHYSEALNWYRKAAYQGYADAQMGVGYMYKNGRSVKKDYAEAMKWFSQAAAQGNPYAQNNIALMYIKGLGVARNEAEALKWFRKAADQGEPFAQNSMGVMHAKGLGAKLDAVEAYFWYSLAVKHGGAVARKNILAVEKQLSPGQKFAVRGRMTSWSAVWNGRVSRPSDGPLTGVGKTQSTPYAKESEDVGQFRRVREALRLSFAELSEGRKACRASFWERCYLSEWVRFLRYQVGKNGTDQMRAINRYINRVRYVSDDNNYGVADLWATASQLLTRGGDCEDYVIAKYVSLRSLGIEASHLRIVVVRDLVRKQAHAVLMVTMNGREYVLDNQSQRVSPANEIRSYRAYYSLNELGWWIH